MLRFSLVYGGKKHVLAGVTIDRVGARAALALKVYVVVTPPVTRAHYVVILVYPVGGHARAQDDGPSYPSLYTALDHKADSLWSVPPVVPATRGLLYPTRTVYQ